MILGYDRYEFGKKLNTLISPSQPIRSVEFLRGRGSELDRIEKALFAAGRNIFIYGDRGVGKSSLAATAANIYQHSKYDYIEASGSPDATLSSIISNIALQATSASRINNVVSKTKLSGNFRYLSIYGETQISKKDIGSEIRSIQDATEVLREVASLYDGPKIVVIDEFDRLKSKEQRSLFADLLKHLGDQDIDIKFIITGVGNSLDELLGAHPSAIRQLETIELPRLSWDARWDITIKTLEHFNIDIDRIFYSRIAALSDGYPYYVHLMTEKLLWRLYERPHIVKIVERIDFTNSLRDAIESISAELKRPYKMAILQPTSDYEVVLWSTADSEWLYGSLGGMYESYKDILDHIEDANKLSYDAYATRIRNLCKPKCGSILVHTNTKGLYTYKEKMLRGYVRMQAEAHGIILCGETAGVEPSQHARVRSGTPSIKRGTKKIRTDPRGYR
ncbi:MAG: ATP-binding protein [Deltaproteobacteria bacterium]|nr:ATP-binding protein [Deltaproteobacteria bacterium]